ncbi:MAG: trigger factor [Myxococcales bacterium]|nr:trigger factor [Myxococcales bacterium]
MHSQISEISPVEVEVTVEVPWERVQRELDSTYSMLGRTARVRGFRPGKAPRNVLQQVYGKRVREDVAHLLIDEGLRSAVEEHALRLVTRPHLTEHPSVRQGEPLTFKAMLEVHPKIEHVDVSTLEAWSEPVSVTDEEVDAQLERLREQEADLREPEPMRGAKENDQLTASYTATFDDDGIDDESVDEQAIDLRSTELLPELYEALLGVTPGETRAVDITFADDHENPKLRGKTGHFEVVVRELRERVLRPLDDEFAKDVSDLETLAELRAQIRESLESRQARLVEARLEGQIIDALIAANPVTPPPSLVAAQQRQSIMDALQVAQMLGERIPEHVGDPARAERDVRAGMLLGALARQEDLEVTDEDIQARLEAIAEQTGKHIAKVRAEHQGEQLEALENELTRRKLMDFLRQRATIHEGKRPATDPTPPEPEPNEEADEA